MARPRVTVAIADHDLNHALIDGRVQSKDLELEIVWDIEDGERHARMLREGAFDACEFSFANYLVARSRRRPFCGIPVFPNRKFRHSYIFCNVQSGIREPRDLEGRRVGLRGWAATASLWVRGILQQFYGVDLTRVRWFALPEPVEVNVPAGIVVERLAADRDLDAMLVARELDAVIYPDVLPSIRRGAPEVRRLFEDYKSAEQAFYRISGIFPISHLIILKEEVVREHPWIPLSLLHTFRQARDACFRRLEEQQVLSLSWIEPLLAEQRSLMGRDYWPYNVAGTRAVLETLVAFAHEQGLIPARLDVEDLFVKETITAPGA